MVIQLCAFVILIPCRCLAMQVLGFIWNTSIRNLCPVLYWYLLRSNIVNILYINMRGQENSFPFEVVYVAFKFSSKLQVLLEEIPSLSTETWFSQFTWNSNGPLFTFKAFAYCGGHSQSSDVHGCHLELIDRVFLQVANLEYGQHHRE